MAKNVARNVSAKTTVNVILKVEFVIVRLVGRGMFVQIAVNLEVLVLIVKMYVNVIMVATVTMLLENVNVVLDLRALNVWTVVRKIPSDLIVPKLAVARTMQSVINPTAIVLARMGGLVSTVVREIARTICMDRTVTIRANVMLTIRKCVIHGPVNAIVNLDGVAVFVIGLVLSLRTAKIVKFPATARTVLSVRTQTVQSDTIKTKREF